MKRSVALPVVAAALALAAVACGGDEAGSDRSGDSPSLTPSELRERYRPDERDRKVHGDRGIERFGRALPDDEAEAVVAVAAGYYDARSRRDWESACDLLSSASRRRLERFFQQSPQLKDKDCAAVMTAVSSRISSDALTRESRGMRFNEVRVKGDRAFAIFKSKAIANGAVEMVRERRRWKVAATSPRPL